MDAFLDFLPRTVDAWLEQPSQQFRIEMSFSADWAAQRIAINILFPSLHNYALVNTNNHTDVLMRLKRVPQSSVSGYEWVLAEISKPWVSVSALQGPEEWVERFLLVLRQRGVDVHYESGHSPV